MTNKPPADDEWASPGWSEFSTPPPGTRRFCKKCKKEMRFEHLGASAGGSWKCTCPDGQINSWINGAVAVAAGLALILGMTYCSN